MHGEQKFEKHLKKIIKEIPDTLSVSQTSKSQMISLANR
jgi:hypothetical protein